MSDPLALLPLAVAAGGGRIDGLEAQQLVAAGLTLLRRSAPLVRALSGRRAAILLPTSAHYLVALGGSEGRGAVLVNPLAAPLEIAHQMREADVGAAFTVSALAGRLPASLPHVLLDEAPRSARVVTTDVTKEVDLGSHVGMDLAGDPEVEGRDEEAAIVYTSAMRGTPLGAVLTHANLLSNARATVAAAAQERDDHVLAVLPFAHLFGLVVSGASPLLAGARVTTMERFTSARALELLESEGVTELVGVPAIFHALAATLDRRGSGLRGGTLRLCICGGAPLSVELQERWFELAGVELRQGYGLTEAGPVCVFNRTDLPNRRGALGVPFPGVEVSIRSVAAEDASTPKDIALPELRPGDVGEICVRGPNVFRGYVRGGAAGLRRLGGWLHTGDLGVLEPDGTVRFTGIYKPMFTRNGFNIYPREIEQAIAELPGVRAVRVRAIPVPARENDIAVEVEGSVGESDVEAWCEQRLSLYKQPSEVRIAD